MIAEGEKAPDFELLDQDVKPVKLSDYKASPVVHGVWVEKKNYGRTYWGNERATFVIAPAGTVAKVFPKVSPKTHDDVVLEALGTLAAA